MSTVTISPKFQVVIPAGVRKALALKSGQKVEVLYYENRIELVPIRPLSRLKGSLKGIDTDIPREPDRL